MDLSGNSPLDQFTIQPYVTVILGLFNGATIYLTNMSIYLIFATYLGIAFNLLTDNYNRILPNAWVLVVESAGTTVQSLVTGSINDTRGQAYYPTIYALFIFILITNLIGMIPYSFSCTSHFILTFFMSFTVVLGSTIKGFMNHKLKFFSILVPAGCPLPLLPLLVMIEFISYLSRNVSLGLRLAANILSGHMLLNILSGFTYKIMTSGFLQFIVAVLPLGFIMAFAGLEFAICFIQAQVFSVLSCSYLKDTEDLH